MCFTSSVIITDDLTSVIIADDLNAGSVNACLLNQISKIHGHLFDLSMVILFDVFHRPHIMVCDDIIYHALLLPMYLFPSA